MDPLPTSHSAISLLKEVAAPNIAVYYYIRDNTSWDVRIYDMPVSEQVVAMHCNVKYHYIKMRKLTKSVPLLTSHPPMSLLKEVAL